MISAVPPALILIAGGLCIPFFRGQVKRFFMLVLPVLAFY